MDSFVERMILEQDNMNGLKHQLHLSNMRIKKYLRADEFEAVDREEYNRQLILKQMKAKEKAKELFDKFMQPIDGLHKYPMCFDTAKQCALIAVDALIGESLIENINYWRKVKQEIEAL